MHRHRKLRLLSRLLADGLLDDLIPTAPAVGVKAEAAADGALDVYVYDVIDSAWGASAKALIDALSAGDAKRVNLRINSPGGDVFEARAMVTAIRAAQAQGREVVSYIDGLAASAASYLALAADRVVMSDGAFLMIHKAWSYAVGNADDLRTTADLLDKVDGSIVDDYERKTGATRDQIVEWMAAETWFTANEAKTYGFVDEITSGEDAPKKARAWKAAFENAPKSLAEPVETTAEDAEGRARAARMVAWHGATADSRSAPVSA